jgi:hypothetical protein
MVLGTHLQQLNWTVSILLRYFLESFCVICLSVGIGKKQLLETPL